MKKTVAAFISWLITAALLVSTVSVSLSASADTVYTVTASPAVVELGEHTPITITVSGGIAKGWYRTRLYKAKSGTHESGIGNAGVDYQGGYYGAADGRGMTIAADGSGKSPSGETLHYSLTQPGVYAYTIMDKTTYHTLARAFITVVDSTGYKNGDVNRNGLIDITDLVRMKKIYMNKADNNYLSDLDRNGILELTDIVLLRKTLIGKASVYDMGALSSTVPSYYSSQFEAEAQKMRVDVISSPDTIKATGTTYYISPYGDDTNSGTSAITPWKTLSRLKSATLNAGDAVLLKRGGYYRISSSVDLVSGVSYGAYGSGNKPAVYGSWQNYATAAWENIGTNLWRLKGGPSGNVGIIVFDHGVNTGYFRYSLSELKSNYDFCNDSGSVVLYLDRDPSKSFTSIELANDIRLFNMPSGSSDIVIENICFRYTGGHAVRGSSCSNVTVRGLEIGYVGGSILTGYGDGTVRFGNGVEFMSESRNVLVENCWIYQIYDSGVTHQGSGNYHLKGFTVKNNLIEYCGMGSIEYWHTPDCDITDVTYENNLMRFAGYGFGGTQRPDKELSGHIMSNGKPTGAVSNTAYNFIIKNNVFELSTNQLINATSSAGTPPRLDGNTYVQWDGRLLGYYENVTNRIFDSSVLSVLTDEWGDKNAEVIIARR